MYHGSPDMTQDINIFEYWKKIKLFQNTPKHAYFQKLEENKTVEKKLKLN